MMKSAIVAFSLLCLGICSAQASIIPALSTDRKSAASSTVSLRNVIRHRSYASSKSSAVALKDTSRQSALCDPNNFLCWCTLAVEYTNEVRRQVGVPDLQVGTASQLANANKYAEYLASIQDLIHQDFDTANAEVGCGRSLNGENIAYNFESGDVARACLDQWINSQGHYRNIVTERFEEGVVGFAYDSRGAVFCVQTFAVMSSNGSPDDQGCEAATSGVATTAPPSPAAMDPVMPPVMPPSPEPIASTVPTTSGDCEKTDTRCWCLKAVEYTNEVRSQNKVPLLKVGTESMLANADKWAQHLSELQNLVHQDFSTAEAEVQCGRRLGGENIAYNFEEGDYARACMDQWINSSGHFRNIVADHVQEVVVGFAFDNRGAVYCVQTFSFMDENNGSSDGSACGPVQA